MVLLSIGPTPSRAKEAYELHLTPGSPSCAPSSQRTHAIAARSVIRSLMMLMSQAEETPLPQQTKIHVAVGHALAASWCGLQACPPGFSPRDKVLLRMKKGPLFVLSVTGSGDLGGVPPVSWALGPDTEDSEQVMPGDRGGTAGGDPITWLLCEAKVKGIAQGGDEL